MLLQFYISYIPMLADITTKADIGSFNIYPAANTEKL